MSTTHATTREKPTATSASGCCMPDHKPQADEPVGKPVEAAKVPSPKVTVTKKLGLSAAKGGGCGCGS